MKLATLQKTFPLYREILSVVALAVLVVVMFTGEARSPISSAEMRIVEMTQNGFQMVPASCASYPHYSGECSTPPAVTSGCTIVANPSTITSGNISDISWNSDTDYTEPYTRRITPTPGLVGYAGSWTVRPTVTTTYTLTATRPSVAPTSYSCSVTVVVNPPACVPTSVCSGGNVVNSCTSAVQQLCSYGCTSGACNCVNICSGSNVVNSCTGALVQTCSYICSSGACVPPPPPTVTFQVAPVLLRSGRTAVATWTSAYTSACTVTEDNPNISDSWTGTSNTRTTSAIAEQTTYTLSCTGLDGSVVTRSKTVNIVPTWQEQ
jgi:trimeric autotransporter adhesin